MSKYFSPNENGLDEGRFEKLQPELLEKLDELRELYGKPIHITSSYRSPEHPIEARKEKPGEHTFGAAVDIGAVGGYDAFMLVNFAMRVGFTRIGVSRKNSFIHLGIGYPGAPEVTLWTY